MAVLRAILATAAGFLAATAILLVLETAGRSLYPPPPGADLADRKALAAFLAGLPAMAFVYLLLVYALASFAGGLAATLAAGRRSLRPALAVGALLLLGGVANVLLIPHPAWFALLSLLAYVPLAWLGGRVVRRPAAA